MDKNTKPAQHGIAFPHEFNKAGAWMLNYIHHMTLQLLCPPAEHAVFDVPFWNVHNRVSLCYLLNQWIDLDKLA